MCASKTLQTKKLKKENLVMTDNIFSNANSFALWIVLFSGWCFISAKINKKHGKTAEYDERQQQLRLLSFRISFFILIVWSLLGMLLAENGILFCDTATMFFLGILLSFTAFFCINTWKNGVERALKRYIQDGTAAGEKCPKCKSQLIFEEGCLHCPQCGYSKCG